MKNYIAYNSIDSEYESFNTIEEAREYLEEVFLDRQEGYHPDIEGCCIFQVKEIVQYDVVDKRENFTAASWPYSDEFDEIWRHRFVDVSGEHGG
jgi:hypothetical protein